VALSMDNAWFFGLVPLGRKKEVAHLLRHQRSKNDPGGESRRSSFTSSYRVLRLSDGSNSRAVPIARLFKIAQF